MPLALCKVSVSFVLVWFARANRELARSKSVWPLNVCGLAIGGFITDCASGHFGVSGFVTLHGSLHHRTLARLSQLEGYIISKYLKNRGATPQGLHYRSGAF